jgi:hypothetical protein
MGHFLRTFFRTGPTLFKGRDGTWRKFTGFGDITGKWR